MDSTTKETVMETTPETTFPGFPSKPTRSLFPLYGVAALPRGYEVSVTYRERRPDGSTRDSGMAPLPIGSFRSQKPADRLAQDLNLRVWSAIR